MSIDTEPVLESKINRAMLGHLLKTDIINLIYYMANYRDLPFVSPVPTLCEF